MVSMLQRMLATQAVLGTLALTVATSYDLPNYVGELFQKAEKPNAVLRLVGGLTGSLRTVGSTQFPMGVDYTLASAGQPAILEGATPTASQLDTNQSENVVQIFQEAVEINYTRQATTGAVSGVAVIPGSASSQLNDPGTLEWQIARKVEKVARDYNYSALRGAYVKPTDNNSARKMRGFRTAVSTNLFANSAVARTLTKTIFENALRDAMANGMFLQGETIYVLGSAASVASLIDLYESATQLPQSREVVGVMVRQIVTKWAVCNVIYEPDCAAAELVLFRPDKCRVVALPIPGKGILFVEPLSKAGATDKSQLYGEMGFDYTHEVFHGVIDDLAA